MIDPLPNRAMVMAAGLGLRMRPLTDDKPKPLIPVCGVTLIDRMLDWLSASGVTDVVVNAHYKVEMLEAHLAARRQPVVHLSKEEVLLETGGGIRKALPLLGDGPFFSANGDAICLDGKIPVVHRLWHAWDEEKMDALLLVQPVENAIGYEGKGDFFVDVSGNIRRVTKGEAAPYVFTGIQLLHPRLFEGAPEGAFSLNVLYNRGMLPNGRLQRICALIHDGAWLHVGDPEGLKKAEAFLQSSKSSSRRA